jgi:hypothetical protein
MNNNDNSAEKKDLSKVVTAQQKRIDELEKQLDYFKKRFIAAKQAVKWFEAKLSWKMEDSYGT